MSGSALAMLVSAENKVKKRQVERSAVTKKKRKKARIIGHFDVPLQEAKRVLIITNEYVKCLEWNEYQT